MALNTVILLTLRFLNDGPSGFGDIIGYKQSGEKDFIVADPMYHSHLFELAKLETDFYIEGNLPIDKFNTLLKFFKKDKILNIIDSG